ncbi:histidine kinase [Kitasatospora sp. NPDC002965]|uniref:histidine kinase n=1 Tax=Kitasatospora sp. NPDC002965 TaxID=3154775 RepID=UPI00339F92BE
MDRPIDGTSRGVALTRCRPHTAPWPVLPLCTAAPAGYTLVGYRPANDVRAPLLAFHTLVVLRPPGRAAAGAAIVAAARTAGAVTAVSLRFSLAQTAIRLGVVRTFGERTGQLALRERQLSELTGRLREERAARAWHAVTEERVRTARELHDVVAHHLSAISVQAGLAE